MKSEKKSSFGKGWATQVSLFVLVIGLIAVMVPILGPDQELSFTREVISELDSDRLNRNLDVVSRWPQWFYSLSEVQILESPSGKAYAQKTKKIEKGSVLKLRIDPRKGSWKRFDMIAQVTEYLPKKRLTLRILDDSSGRLVRIFDRMDWKIELLPGKNGKGSLIRGQVFAHTCHWRSRLFGRMAEKILLNQVFYPNLIQLAQLKQPFSVEAPSLSPGYGSP